MTHNSSSQAKNQADTVLQTQVENLATKVKDRVSDNETKQKIQTLLKQIKSHLQRQQLSLEMQRELARLIGLLSSLETYSPQQIDVLDLAISTLLEQEAIATVGVEKKGLVNFPQSNRKCSHNLALIQEIRKQITLQTQPYPHPFHAILTGKGGSYNRLISGLSWFFMIFVILPLLGIAGSFVVLNSLEVATLQVTNNRLKSLTKELEITKTELKQTKQVRNSLEVQLRQVQTELKNLGEPKTSATVPVNPNNNTVANGNNNLPVQPQIVAGNLQTQVNQLDQKITEELESVAKSDSEMERVKAQVVISDSSSTTNTNDSSINNTSAANPKQTSSEQGSSQDVSTDQGASQGSSEDEIKWSVFADWFFKSEFYVLTFAVSMGALGSSISVIVRANQFIKQSQEGEGQADLFFTGFFRPIVGMSFAIFAVALIESGIFSGIFSIERNKDRNVYIYITIAFIAGFSERLIQDVMLRTEDTFTGFSSRDQSTRKSKDD